MEVVNEEEINEIGYRQENSFTVYQKRIIGLAAIFFGLVLVFYFFNFHHKFGDQQQFAWFGDFVGGTLTPILSFLTIVLILYSLKLQIGELKNSNLELNRSSSALEATLKIHDENINLQKRDLIRIETKEAFELMYDRTVLLFDSEEFSMLNSENSEDTYSLRQINDLWLFRDSLDIHPDQFPKFNIDSIEHNHFKRLCHKNLDDLVGLLSELNSKIFSEYIKIFNAERVTELVKMAHIAEIIDESVNNSLIKTIKKTNVGRVETVSDDD